MVLKNYLYVRNSVVFEFWIRFIRQIIPKFFLVRFNARAELG